MKIPLIYPKIPSPENCPLKKCVAFEKYDGTNIHWEWSRQAPYSWVSFGTRRSQFDYGSEEFAKEHPGLEQALDTFEEINIGLDELLISKSVSKAIIFTEFYGRQHSFAGQHVPDDRKTLTIIDAIFDDRMLPPDEFEKTFKGLPAARVVYRGKYNGRFIEDVREDRFNVNEGVVCKGLVGGKLHMTKIKTNEYMRKLQQKYNSNWKDYWE